MISRVRFRSRIAADTFGRGRTRSVCVFRCENLIRAGEEHPGLFSKDLKKDPIIPGREAVMTVVKVGDALTGKFKAGQRFIIKEDIYVNGKGCAYGYAINGGMEQYSVIDQRILNGDEGGYLLPLPTDMPSGVAALLEPWTCVQASYMIENRTAPKPGGRVLIAAGDRQVYSAGKALRDARPVSVVGLGLSREAVEKLNAELGVEMALIEEIPSGVEFDDIFLCNLARLSLRNRRPNSAAAARLRVLSGIISGRSGMFDVGRIPL